MVAFVTVHAGSYGRQQVKSFSKDFTFLTVLVLPLPPRNEKHAAGLRRASPRDSSRT